MRLALFAVLLIAAGAASAQSVQQGDICTSKSNKFWPGARIEILGGPIAGPAKDPTPRVIIRPAYSTDQGQVVTVKEVADCVDRRRAGGRQAVTGDICTSRSYNWWPGQRVDIRGGPSAGPAHDPEPRFIVGPPGEDGHWLRADELTDCVERSRAPETLARVRQAEEQRLAVQRQAAERAAAQAPIDESGGKLVELSPEFAREVAAVLTRRHPQTRCPELREIYSTARNRWRIVCGNPAGPLFPYAFVVDMNISLPGELAFVRRVPRK